MTKDEVLAEALECMEAAIKSGDWKVDGACDPTMTIQRIKQTLNPEFPVAWMEDEEGNKYEISEANKGNFLKGFQTPFFYLAEGRDGVTRFFRDTSHIPAGFFILGKIKLEHL